MLNISIYQTFLTGFLNLNNSEVEIISILQMRGLRQHQFQFLASDNRGRVRPGF